MTKKFNKENGVGLEEIVCSKCGELQSTIDKQK